MDLLVSYTEHTRTRLVEGHTEAAGPEGIIRCIESILTKSREKRPHRKSHGRISFGDLARTIADKWKSIDPQSKAIFDQYADVDMLRYRKEVKMWKDKKEREAEATSMGGSRSLNHASFNSTMNNSFPSVDSSDTELRLNDLPSEEASGQERAGSSWQPRNPPSLHDSLSSSYSSVESELSLEPMPINTMQLQMQMQIQIQMQQMQMQQHQRHHQQQQQQQQHYTNAYQQHQANSQVNFIANANQRSMTLFPALGGGYGNASFNLMAPGNYGNASSNSLAPSDALLGVSSSQVSDYTSSNPSGHTSGNFSSSSHASGNWGQ